MQEECWERSSVVTAQQPDSDDGDAGGEAGEHLAVGQCSGATLTDILLEPHAQVITILDCTIPFNAFHNSQHALHAQ